MEVDYYDRKINRNIEWDIYNRVMNVNECWLGLSDVIVVLIWFVYLVNKLLDLFK